MIYNINYNRRLILVIIVVWLIGGRLWGQGTTGGAMLKIPVGSFMGGNEFFSGSGSGSALHAIYFPSVLGGLNNLAAGTHYRKTGWDLNYFNGIIAYPVSGKIVLGVAVQTLMFPEIDRKVFSNQGIYEKDGTINVGAITFPLLLSYSISEQFSFGLKAQYYNEKLDKYSANTFMFGFDVSFKNLFENTTAISLGARNMGGGLKFYKESSPLPLSISGEISFIPNALPGGFLLQVEKYKDEDIRFGAGIEYQYNNLVFIHGGYAMNETESKGLLVGMGIKTRGLSVAYDYEPTEYFDDLHKISLYYSLPAKFKQPDMPKPVIQKEVPETKPIVSKKEAVVLPEPSKLKSSMFGGELHIEWEYDIFKFQDVYFEVFASLKKDGKWVKISKGEMRTRTMTFQPTKRGITFYFKIRALRGDDVSQFSKLLRVNVK